MIYPPHPDPILRLAQAALFTLGAAGATTLRAEPDPVRQQLPEITVSAHLPLAPAAPGVLIGSEELARRNAIDMGAIARYEPLVSVPAAVSGSGNIWDGAGNTGFNLRGIEGNRISIDVDGVALPDAAAKPDATSMNAFGTGRDYFDPATLREVRIGAGTSPAGPGTPGLGGSIGLTTRAPEDYLGPGKDLYGSYALGNSSAGGTRSHTLTGAARSGMLQALLLLVRRSGHANDNKGSVAANPDDWRSQALLGKFNWKLDPRQSLGLTLDAYRRDNLRTFANKLSAAYPEGAQQDGHTSRARASLGHRVRAATPWFDTLDSRVYVQDATVEDRTRARYITGGQPTLRNIDTRYVNRSSGLAADAMLGLGDTNALHYGVAAEHSASSRPWQETRTLLASGAQQITAKNRMADMDSDKASAYLRADVALAKGSYPLLLTPGLRAEYRRLTPKNLGSYAVALPTAARELTSESDSSLLPSLQLSIALTPVFAAYGQVSRGARLPSAAERTGTYDSFSYTGSGNGYAVLGNPDLAKETSTAFELGLKGEASKGVRLSATLFQSRFDNFIDYVAQPPDPVNYPTVTFGLYRPQNLGSARTWGGEASLRLALGAWSPALAGVSLSAAAGVAHGSATNKLTGIKGGLGSTLPRKMTLGAAYDAPRAVWGMALTAVASAARQAPPDVITGVGTPRFAIPGAGVGDLFAYWKAGSHTRLELGIYNLGDKRYWDYATSRSLPAGTNAIALADIERQARPGRNVAATLSIHY